MSSCQLHAYINNKNYDLLRLALEKKLWPIDELNDFNETPLDLAARNGDLRAVEILFEYGAKPTIEYSTERPTITLAKSFVGKNLNVIKKLIEHGCDPNVQLDNYEVQDNTTWDVVVALDNAEIMEYLLELHPGNKQDAQFLSSVLISASRKSKKIVRYLLGEFGDRLRGTTDESGESTYYRAIADCQSDTIFVALVGVNKEVLSEVGIDGQSLAHKAVAGNNKALLAKLIRHGVDPNRVDAHGKTPLHYAVDQGLDELALLLLDRGADPSIPDQAGDTALHLFLQHGESLRLLRKLAKGTDLYGRNSRGLAPLHLAVGAADELVFQQMAMRYCESIDYPDGGGKTALHYAVEGRKLGAVEFLLDVGARVEGLLEDGAPLVDEPVKACVARALVKRAVAGMRVGSRLAGVFGGGESDFADLCLEEVRRMKETRIRRESRSVYDFLVAERHLSVVLVGEPFIGKMVRQGDRRKVLVVDARFPIYKAMLQKQYWIGCRYCSCYDLAATYLYTLSRCCLPARVLHKIMSFLGESDMRNVIECGESFNRFERNFFQLNPGMNDFFDNMDKRAGKRKVFTATP